MTRRALRPVAIACLMLGLLVAAPLAGNAATRAGTIAAPTRSARVAVGRATGEFSVALDRTTFALQPLGTRCLLTVDGTLFFTGTLQGTATATTAALEDATCAEVATNPSGTFADVFRSTAAFSGTVDGQPVGASLVYAGRTSAGGSIDAIMWFAGGLTGVLHVRATVAVGGTYDGVLVRH